MRWLLFLVAAIALGCYPSDIDLLKRQPKYLPYTASTFFADGRAMRPPPLGTVPREAVLDEAAPPVTMMLLELGRHDFDIFCAACHGRRGDGKSVVATKMALRRPPSLVDPPASALSRQRVVDVIAQGYGLMPSYAEMLPARSRWAIAHYLRALERSQRAKLAELPPDLRQHFTEAP